jgi:putative ABC transport system permease protein
MTPQPPRVAEWLIRRSIVWRDRDSVLGDLREEFVARSSAESPRAAAAWYWRQVRQSLGPNVRRRVRDVMPSDQTPDAPRRLVGLGLDVRYAIRSLRASPGLTAVALLVLTLGIGAMTAIFSIVDAVVLRPLPYPQPDRLVALRQTTTATRPEFSSVTSQDFVDWTAQQDVFEGLAATVPGSGTDQEAPEPEALQVRRVSPNLFAVLRVGPRLGHAFTTEREVTENPYVAVISDGYWRRRFGADPNVIGRILPLDNGNWQIEGVMPPGFDEPFSESIDLWTPYVMSADERTRGQDHNNHLQVVARLKPGVTLAQARARMDQISAALASAYPDWYKRGGRALVYGLADWTIGAQVRSWMLMLLGAVTCVLLIACVNVANLLLARATTRGHEIGLRAALGAGQWRLTRGLLVEGVLLSAAGTALAVAAAYGVVNLLRTSLPPGVPRAAAIAVNGRVLAMALLASVVTGVTFGLVPAIVFSGEGMVASLRDSGRGGTASRARQRLRATLVVAEVALAAALAIGAGLFATSFIRLLSVKEGFDYHGVLTARAVPFETGGTAADRTTAGQLALKDLAARLRAMPGVDSVGVLGGALPLSGAFHRLPAQVPGRAEPLSGDDSADVYYVTPEYLPTMRVPMIRGRAFTDADDRADGDPVVVLNQTAARRYFGDEDPIGRTIGLPTGTTLDVFGMRTIVGIVGDERPLGPETSPRPEAYSPLAQGPYGNGYLVLRTNGDPEALVPVVKALVSSVMPKRVVPPPATLESLFGRLIAQRRFNMLLVGLFGVLAMAIAAAGLYGVMSYLVAQRTQEIGVRMALGAAPIRVIGMVLRQAVGLLATGLVLGLVLAWSAAGFLRAFLFQVSAHDLGVYAGVPVILLLAGLGAAYFPARRAARVDPLIALRSE